MPEDTQYSRVTHTGETTFSQFFTTATATNGERAFREYSENGTSFQIRSERQLSDIVYMESIEPAGLGLDSSPDRKRVKTGYTPQIYFKYVKLKMGVLEKIKFDSRMKKVKKVAEEVMANGQVELSKKMMIPIAIATKESMLYARGFRKFIDKKTLNKYKNKIKNGHISDTKLSKYTRLIPKDVIKKYKKVEEIFDDFIIYHYWSPEAKDIKSMSPAEKESMKDPILFGIMNENPDKLYFIADWIDEYCDLTFDELIDVIDLEEDEVIISSKPKIDLVE